MSHQKNRRYHRAVTADALLGDLRAVAARLQTNALTMADYDLHGQFGMKSFRRLFGRWNVALVQAGLEPAHKIHVSRSELIEDIQRVAKLLGVTRLSLLQYCEYSHHCARLIYDKFKSWQAAAAAAGVVPVAYHPSKTELLDNLRQLWEKLGHRPREMDVYRPISRFSLKSYYTHFGTLRRAFECLADPAIHFDPSLNLIQKLKHSRDWRRKVSYEQRYKTLVRDGFRCRACGRSPATEAGVRLEIDHVHPWSRGGKTVLANLQTLCHECNKGKSNSVETNEEVGTMSEEAISERSEEKTVNCVREG